MCCEYDIGYTPLGYHPSGRWTVIREPDRYAVVFYAFKEKKLKELASYPATEHGMEEAKKYARSLLKRSSKKKYPIRGSSN